MNLIPLPAFQDNYLWLLHDGRRALVVDPGDAQPVLDCLAQNSLHLEAILVTHHHPDHVGGVDTLRGATGARVWGPARERIPEPFEPLADGDRIQALGLEWLRANVEGLEPKVYGIPEEIDREVARLKLESMGVDIGAWTPEQKAYAESYESGT